MTFPPPHFTLSRTHKLIIAAVLIVPVVGFGLYTWGALTWSYSKGERAGYVQKFSKKGWICKTWEGELALVYHQHVGIPTSCFGDTQYFVVGVKSVE